MSDRFPSICRGWILATAMLAASGGIASVGRTQQLAGSIGVSLTILQPVASEPVRVTGFSVDRSGLGRFQTTVPTSARTSQLVMTRVSSATMDAAREPQSPTLVPPSDTASRIRFLVPVGRALRDADADPVRLRVEFLTVAGT